MEESLTINRMNDYYVYILTNERNTLLYIGVTNNLVRRLYEHKNRLNEGFTKDYWISKLVYFESCHSIEDAIRREKQLVPSAFLNAFKYLIFNSLVIHLRLILSQKHTIFTTHTPIRSFGFSS